MNSSVVLDDNRDDEEIPGPFLYNELKKIQGDKALNETDKIEQSKLQIKNFLDKSVLFKRVLAGETSFEKVADKLVKAGNKLKVLSSGVSKNEYIGIVDQTENFFYHIYDFSRSDVLVFPTSKRYYLLASLFILGTFFAAENYSLFKNYTFIKEALALVGIEILFIIPALLVLRMLNLSIFHEDLARFKQNMHDLDLLIKLYR